MKHLRMLKTAKLIGLILMSQDHKPQNGIPRVPGSSPGQAAHFSHPVTLRMYIDGSGNFNLPNKIAQNVDSK
jgi:hypothetical protein